MGSVASLIHFHEKNLIPQAWSSAHDKSTRYEFESKLSILQLTSLAPGFWLWPIVITKTFLCLPLKHPLYTKQDFLG